MRKRQVGPTIVTSFGRNGLQINQKTNASEAFIERVLAAARKRWPELRLVLSSLNSNTTRYEFKYKSDKFREPIELVGIIIQRNYDPNNPFDLD